MGREEGRTTILLLGAGGQIGRELQRSLADHPGRLVIPDRAAADLSRPESLRAVVRESRPQVIVNAAAYTAVDRAEQEQELAMLINGVSPGVLAEEAEALGACMVHYSTDYVFDGTGTATYTEDDAVNPLQAYGRTKLAGERAVQRSCRRHLVLRTSWVFAAHGHNFVRTMLRLAAERDELRVVADQVGAPTSAALIADVTSQALRALREQDAQPTHARRTGPSWGLYHLTASGRTSWHGLARHVIARGIEAGLPLRATPATVIPISSAEYPVPAARPARSCLDTSRLRGAFGVALADWTLGVDDVVSTLAHQSQPTGRS